MDPRVALSTLTNALEEHLSASLNRRGQEDPAVESAFYGVADAFEGYEDALFGATGEVTPLDLYDEDDDTEYNEDPDDTEDRADSFEADDDDDEEILDEQGDDGDDEDEQTAGSR